MKFAGRVDRHAGQVRFRKRYVQRSSFRYGNRRAVGQGEVDVLRILSNVPEERFSGRSRLARRFAEPFPRCAVGVGDVPVFLFDFQLGRNAVLSIFTVFLILTVFSVFPVAAFGFYLVAETVCQPFAVQCPVPDAVGVLTDTDCRRQSLVAFIAFVTFLSMIYGDRVVVEKTECVADDGGALDNRNDIGYAVVVLQYIDNGL